MLKKQHGFTLIELLVVVIIVAILAAVGLPLLTGNVNRARGSEADAGLGTTRTEMRAALVQNGGAFPAIAAGTAVIGTLPGLQAGDLTGRYFDDDDYSFAVTTTATTFCVNVAGGTGVAVASNSAQVVGVNRSMDQNGTIYAGLGCAAGGAPTLN